MLWLARPPYLRWAAAALVVAVAAWSEFSPPPTTTLAFMATDVPAGTRLDPSHVTRRQVPLTGVVTVEPEGVAAIDLRAGDPLLASMVAEVEVPEDWNLISAPVPAHAVPGVEATGVILEEEQPPVEFPAVVVSPGTADAFGDSSGTVAVSPEWTAAAAAAAAAGRLVIGVSASGP